MGRLFPQAFPVWGPSVFPMDLKHNCFDTFLFSAAAQHKIAN